MAEIGLAASIISVAAFGASVATTLYETADIMKNANQQIRALAKHVTQFTAVLNHMGQVLKTEKINSSKEVLRDIRKIQHSCKRTFREINSTVKAGRFRRLMWLFKRTKAMELEARLDSQQSMLQCMIHTLTVSKLSHMDSRSEEDSGHITSLKVEITLLKTFIKESYENLSALQRAEHLSAEQSKAQYQPVSGDGSHPTIHHTYVDRGVYPADSINAPSAFEPPITRSPSPTSNVPKSDNEESNTDDGDDDHRDDVSSTKSQDQNNHDGAGPNRQTSSAAGLILGGPNSNPYRESNILAQMVPYSPSGPAPVRSDRLITGGHGPDSGTTSATQEVTKSVRLLLDKWTTSGSAPISNILDEEAAREKDEAELANEHRTSNDQFEYRRSSPPLYFDPTDEPGPYEHFRRFQGGPTPPAPRWHNPHEPYVRSSHKEMDFSRPFHNLSQPPSRQLGEEILTQLRSVSGGIYYVKSNDFKQVHYVDQYPIYTCIVLPSHFIQRHEDNNFLNTELGIGLVRGEALDLLAYSYTKSETGSYIISGSLRLGEIEELVRLSYQALERNLEERSKTVMKERGWGEAMSAVKPVMPEMSSYEPWAVPQHENIPFRRPENWSIDNPPDYGYIRPVPYTEHERVYPYESGPFQAPLPRISTRERSSARRRTRPIMSPPPSGRQGQDATKTTRPEVRFTIPRTELVSDIPDIAKDAQTSSAKPDIPTTKTDDKLQSVRQKLIQIKKKKDEAEKAKDRATVSDLSTYVIPDIEAELEALLKQQREEQDKSAPPRSQNEEDKRSRRTEVETESEDDDDEDRSDA